MFSSSQNKKKKNKKKASIGSGGISKSTQAFLDNTKVTSPKITNAVQTSVVTPSTAQAVPKWFKEAIGTVPEKFHVKVENDVFIHTHRWGKSKNKQALLFIHGGGASACWYDMIAPFFADDYDCIALSNSGNGLSSYRDGYSIQSWAKEIYQVCLELKVFDRPLKPYIVCHSLGVFVSLYLLEHVAPARSYQGAILVDGVIRPLDEAKMVRQRMIDLRKSSADSMRDGWVKNSLASVKPVERFKLKPLQDCENFFIMEYIANSSVNKSVDDAGNIWWQWLGDHNREFKLDWETAPFLTDEVVINVAKNFCDLIVMHGSESILCDESLVSFWRERFLRHNIPIVTLADAAHHVWLDKPTEFVASLKGMLAGWRGQHCKNVDYRAILEEEDDPSDALTQEAILESRL